MGQLAIPGTSFTAGRDTLAAPTADAQKIRISDGVALGGAQVLAIPSLLDGDGAAAFQGRGAGGDGEDAEQPS